MKKCFNCGNTQHLVKSCSQRKSKSPSQKLRDSKRISKFIAKKEQEQLRIKMENLYDNQSEMESQFKNTINSLLEALDAVWAEINHLNGITNCMPENSAAELLEPPKNERADMFAGMTIAEMTGSYYQFGNVEDNLPYKNYDFLEITFDKIEQYVCDLYTYDVENYRCFTFRDLLFTFKQHFRKTKIKPSEKSTLKRLHKQIMEKGPRKIINEIRIKYKD